MTERRWEHRVRIGIVSEYCRPWPGGISEHVHHEAEELGRRGHEVTVISGPASAGWHDVDQHVERVGFEFVFTHNGARSRMALGRYLLGYRRMLRRHAFDVLHVHAPLDPFLGFGALYASVCPTVGTFHANFDQSWLWDLLYRRLRFVTLPAWQRMHARIAVSPEAHRSISHYFPGDYTIIPNGVDTERFRPDNEPLPALADGGKKILFVGRADPRKGLPLLLDAFAQVRRSMPDVQLVIVGVERAEITDSLASMDAEDARAIRCEGYVAAADMGGCFAACDVFCSPAVGQESQGIVLLEAMAAGRPPVAFAIPGYRDVVAHNGDGWLVEPRNVGALAEALTKLLADDTCRRRLGDEGRRTALGYAWPNVVERIEAVFEVAKARWAEGPSAR
jgi:phosphatidylinositol alpha-mannosyltransferase